MLPYIAFDGGFLNTSDFSCAEKVGSLSLWDKTNLLWNDPLDVPVTPLVNLGSDLPDWLT